MAALVNRANLLANQRQQHIQHGLDLDALRLPILPPGPYVSSDGMSDDVEILEEAPVNMRKKTVVIDLLDTDSEDEGEGDSADNAGEGEEDEESDNDSVAVVIPLRRKRSAVSPSPPPKRRKGKGGSSASGSKSANTYTLGGAVAGQHAREAKRVKRRGDAGRAGPSRAARNAEPAPAPREPAMMIAFGDEDAQEVPLGWGGLGIPDRDPPELAVGHRSPSPVAPAASGSSSRRRSRGSAASPVPPVSPLRLASSPPPAAPAPKDASDYLPAVLEVIPDICTTWAHARLQAELDAGRPDPASNVIQAAFEMEPSYPLAKKAGTSKVAKKKEEVNFRSEAYKADERRGDVYDDKSISLLNELFPMIPVLYLRESFGSHSRQLVPTYFALVAASAPDVDPKPYQPLKVGRNAKGKGRSLLYEAFTSNFDNVPDDNPFLAQQKADGRAMYDVERKWLAEYIKQEAVENDAQKAKDIAHAEALANGGGMECGCCFGEELMEDMFQCNEGHLFCRNCTTMHIETKLGEQKHTISCMDTSSCPALFPDSEITRILPAKSLQLYHRLKQASELDSANIEGLETCPNCPFSAIIDNPDEKLFRCMAPECGSITCRKCKKEEHLPKTCEEMEADRKLDKRHAVEDAMSDALIRRCPNAKCGKPFYKEEGCNKMTCQMCQTISCYVCRKIITNGYAHFNQDPANYGRPAVAGRCALWDTQGNQDAQAVIAARDAAQVLARQAAAAEGVQLAEADLNVEAPIAPVRPAYPGGARIPIIPGLDHAAIAQANLAMQRMAVEQQQQHLAFMRAQAAQIQGPGAIPPPDIGQMRRDMEAQRQIIDGLYAAQPGLNAPIPPAVGLGVAAGAAFGQLNPPAVPYPQPQPPGPAVYAPRIHLRPVARVPPPPAIPNFQPPPVDPAAHAQALQALRVARAAQVDQLRVAREQAAALLPGHARPIHGLPNRRRGA